MKNNNFFYELKIAWCILCFIATFALSIIFNIGFVLTIPPSSIGFVGLVAASISIPAILQFSLKTKVFYTIGGAWGGLIAVSNMVDGQDPLFGDGRPATAFVLGAIVWVVWAVVEIIIKIFKKNNNSANSRKVVISIKSSSEEKPRQSADHAVPDKIQQTYAGLGTLAAAILQFVIPSNSIYKTILDVACQLFFAWFCCYVLYFFYRFKVRGRKK